MAQVARASVSQFQQRMAELTPAESGYNDPVFAREVVLELRSMLNKEHKRAGECNNDARLCTYRTDRGGGQGSRHGV